MPKTEVHLGSVGQCHAAPPLVGPGQRDVCVGNVEDRISGHKRRRVAVRPQSQVDEVEHRWRTGEILESPGVAVGSGLQVGCFHRHGMELFGT